MKHIIKIFTSLFLLSTVFMASCDTDKDWIYVEAEPQPGVEIAGSAFAYKSTFRSVEVDRDTDGDEGAKSGVSTMYTWLKASGDFSITVTDLEGVATKYGKGSDVSDITSALVADGPAFKVPADGLYFLIYNNKLEQLTIMPAKFGVIGGATAGGWNDVTAFTDVSFNAETSKVTMKGNFAFTKGEMKFRFNDWGIAVPYEGSSTIKYHTNMGSPTEGANLSETEMTLKGGGDNINIMEGAQYDVTFEYDLSKSTFSAKAKQGEIIVPSYPENLYMIGAEFGNWNWEDARVVRMSPVNGTEGAFWTIKYFTQGQQFKWGPQNDVADKWNGSFPSLGENSGFEVAGGNATVAQDGLYMVYIDMKAGKMAIEKPKVYGIGDAFGAWDAATFPFTMNSDGKTMTIKTTAAGTLRMHTTSSIAAGLDWWRMEFIVVDGKIVYRENSSSDPEKVDVTAGQKVTLNFATNTGTIE